MLYAWILQAASESLVDYPSEDTSLFDYLATVPGNPFTPWWSVVVHAPFVLIVTLAIVFGPKIYGVKMKRPGKPTWPAVVGGIVHGLAHLCATILLMWMVSPLATLHLYAAIDLFLALAAIFLLGSIVGGAIMAAYLYLANCLYHAHDEEIFSCQAIIDYKCFARFHVNRDGVTFYPIGLKAVPRRWKPAPGVILTGKTGHYEPHYELEAPDGTVRIFEPEAPYTLEPRLIERPIKL